MMKLEQRDFPWVYKQELRFGVEKKTHKDKK